MVVGQSIRRLVIEQQQGNLLSLALLVVGRTNEGESGKHKYCVRSCLRVSVIRCWVHAQHTPEDRVVF